MDRKYFRFCPYFTGILLQNCGKLSALPVEKAVENFATIFMPLFKYFSDYKHKINDLCKTQEKRLEKKF
jgi:hypothetical protein